MRKNKNNNKGFSLVELIIVIAILAILVGVLAPQYVKYVEKSRKAADVSNVENVVTAIKVTSSDEDYDLPQGTYTVTLSNGGMVIASTDAASALTKNEGTVGALTRALIEYMGVDGATFEAGKATYTGVKLKSQKWGDDGGAAPIVATATVSETGAVSVKYEPKAFNDYASVPTT
ncbi:prepilin-type N-terminal cleavage/methylation domain-containing protein [Blautia schinkii]|nr:prepilin-type N-terminal cleavage/methylation domain-containing protein [Blautia schinkii]